MSILYDFHMHSSLSTDSDAPMEDMVRRAAKLGLSGICLTEHMDADFPYEPGAFEASPRDEWEEVSRLRRIWDPRFCPGADESPETAGGEKALPDYSGILSGSAASDYPGSMAASTGCSGSGERKLIKIGYGMELGMQSHLVQRFDKLASDWPFDFLNISQHLVLGKDPYFAYEWDGMSVYEMIRTYYEEMYSNLRIMTQWDSLSHLDYIIRYIPERGDLVYDSLKEHRDIVAAILEYVISRGKCLEVNTAGFKYGLGQTHPSREVLMLYRDLGGEQITIGSDAHAPEHIAIAFAETEKMLLECGFRTYTIFENRIPEEIPL